MCIADKSENEVCETDVAASKNIMSAGNDTNINLNASCSIELITGSAVIDFLLNPEFQKSMDNLFDACTWATIFQSRLYITAWYQSYQEKHLPILVKGEVNGHLTGVLAVALLHTHEGDRRYNGNRITGAGHYDAEYQTWLAMPAYGESFIKEALGELMKQFPGHPITFRYLPPGTPLTWIKDDKQWRSYSTLQLHARPLIKLSEPDHAKLLESKQFKNKLNRLKKLGEVHLECITDLESFKSYLDELAVLHDFRFGALFNKHIFQDDPAKKEFLLELFRLQLLHATIFKVDGKIFSAVVAIAGRGWVSLSGFTCHSPFKARSYSPGLLHFSFLAKRLKEERIQYFDLTPGNDSYKEKLANTHDEVHELVISSKVTYRVKRRIRKWVHNRLLTAGIRPMTVELTLKKHLYRLRNVSVTAVVKGVAKWFQKKTHPKRYIIPANAFKPGAKVSLQKNNLDHLMQFKTDRNTGITRWEFLADAMYRFETGQHCYTWTENNRLLSCAWLNFSNMPSEEKNSNHQKINNDVELQNLYCHIKARNELPSFLFSVIDDVMSETNSIGFSTNNKSLCQALESIGLKPE